MGQLWDPDSFLNFSSFLKKTNTFLQGNVQENVKSTQSNRPESHQGWALKPNGASTTEACISDDILGCWDNPLFEKKMPYPPILTSCLQRCCKGPKAEASRTNTLPTDLCCQRCPSAWVQLGLHALHEEHHSY